VSAFFPRFGLLAAASFLAFSGPALAAPPRVVASVAPVHSLVATVTEGVSVPYLLLRGGASPHSYSLNPSDSRALSEAGMIVWVGEGLEAFLRKPLASLGAHARIVELQDVDGMTLLPRRDGGVWAEAKGRHAAEDRGDRGHAHREAHDHGNVDPHLWLDTGNAARILDAVASTLAQLDPDNAARYRANAAAGRTRLTELSQEIAEMLLPVRSRPFIVFHDAWQYFEREFGLAAAGSIALSPERKPGARRLVEIRDRIRDAKVVCVFSEPQFSPALVETVIRGTSARSASLDPLGAALLPGPEHYGRMMRALAADLLSCLRRDRR